MDFQSVLLDVDLVKKNYLVIFLSKCVKIRYPKEELFNLTR